MRRGLQLLFRGATPETNRVAKPDVSLPLAAASPLPPQLPLSFFPPLLRVVHCALRGVNAPTPMRSTIQKTFASRTRRLNDRAVAANRLSVRRDSPFCSLVTINEPTSPARLRLRSSRRSRLEFRGDPRFSVSIDPHETRRGCRS